MPGSTQQFFAQYEPSLAAAITVTALFAITTAVHIAQITRHRTLYFIPFAIGGICEIAGYIARSIAAAQYPNTGKAPYIAQTILPLMAPSQFAAAMYMLLGCVIRTTDGGALCLVRASWLTKIITVGDIASGIIQSIGGITMATAASKTAIERGEDYIALGLAVQLVVLCMFAAASVHYGVRLRNNPTVASRYVCWQSNMGVLYLTIGLILVRTVFRLVEYVQGDAGILRSSEIYLYVLDAALMLSVMLAFNLKHPSTLAVRAQPVPTESDEVSESNVFLLQERGTK
ncbi:hypothetical protein SLS55_002760 [Diplodia seriata]|uniref:Uncharacterized protein n=1 Tax=Diplodia seriata TaxID=420778 RepID=A0ABR3CM66_9PEZI